KRGWFFDNIEFQPGVKCIAVPVRNRLNIVAGVSISMPADRLTDEKKDSIIADMLELSHKLSMEIGGAANNNLL
ncbi:MAG: IclR family transcriptional regulator, partial [Deltaproteobacteria bacterium]|nr:IclR family transcriptional regulator [Deltaproteobacteria bacterium]